MVYEPHKKSLQLRVQKQIHKHYSDIRAVKLIYFTTKKPIQNYETIKTQYFQANLCL